MSNECTGARSCEAADHIEGCFSGESPAEVLEISGVQFEIGWNDIIELPTLSLTCVKTFGPFIFDRKQLGALAAWLNDHAEAGGE